MNRHRIQVLRAAAAEYQQHVEHQQRLIAALNEGRLQPKASALFGAPRPAAKVKRLRRVAA